METWPPAKKTSYGCWSNKAGYKNSRSSAFKENYEALNTSFSRMYTCRLPLVFVSSSFFNLFLPNIRQGFSVCVCVSACV